MAARGNGPTMTTDADADDAAVIIILDSPRSGKAFIGRHEEKRRRATGGFIQHTLLIHSYILVARL